MTDTKANQPVHAGASTRRFTGAKFIMAVSPSIEKLRESIGAIQSGLADAQPDAATLRSYGERLSSIGSAVTAALEAEYAAAVESSEPNAA